jgi:hypothetical protein
MSMSVLWNIVVLLVGGIVVAVFWDAFLRGRRGKALALSALALAAILTGGALQANNLFPWSLIALVVGVALSAMSDGLSRRQSRTPHTRATAATGSN